MQKRKKKVFATKVIFLTNFWEAEKVKQNFDKFDCDVDGWILSFQRIRNFRQSSLINLFPKTILCFKLILLNLIENITMHFCANLFYHLCVFIKKNDLLLLNND
jgi:hypothetical protein